MNKTAPETDKSSSLNARRRRAVEMRLEGASLASIAAEVNLSSPTIINAHKAFMEGGWPAVDKKPRGRSSGAVALGVDENVILGELLELSPESFAQQPLWSYRLLQQWLTSWTGKSITLRTATKYAERWNLHGHSALADNTLLSGSDRATLTAAKKRGLAVYSIGQKRLANHSVLHAHDGRGSFTWIVVNGSTQVDDITDFLQRLLALAGKSFFLLVNGIDLKRQATLQQWFEQNHCEYLQCHNKTLTASPSTQQPRSGDQSTNPSEQEKLTAKRSTATQELITQVSSIPSNQSEYTQDKTMKTQPDRLQQKAGAEGATATTKPAEQEQKVSADIVSQQSQSLTHLQRLEAESIHILREVIAEADKPVMLHSLGKDSAVMLHLARKAFFPAPIPMPLLHVDTTWKFKAMYQYRDELAADPNIEMIVHKNEEGIRQGVNPITHGSALHTDIMKTQGLRQAIDKHEFDVAVAGARRDEEGTRAKERVFSFRSDQHRWDPRNQRPELWNVYNTRKQPKESIRVFPLSNWTELDVWQYILLENISVVPLYFAAERPVVERDGNLILVDDDRLTLNEGEVPSLRKVRFRTLGCYPLTGASESTATSLPEIIAETFMSKTSERSGRMIDHDSSASMEQKKQEGYF